MCVYSYTQGLLFNAEAQLSDLAYHSHEVWVSHWYVHVVLSSSVKLLEQPACLGAGRLLVNTRICLRIEPRLVPSHRLTVLAASLSLF